MAAQFCLLTIFFYAFSFVQAVTFVQRATVNPAFSAVYHEGAPGQGIGGYNLLSTDDKSFALDFKSTGKQDHIVLYRPGKGAIFIVSPQLNAVVSHGDPGPGLGGFDLSNTADLAFAFDFDHSGKMDHIVFYRPGTGLVSIVGGPAMSMVFNSSTGIGGFDLLNGADLGLAFDYGGTGKQDHLVFYRPGTGAVFVIAHNADNTFSAVYSQGAPGLGIGGFDLSNAVDRVFSFDFGGKGLVDHLVLYRPGSGNVTIVGLGSDGKTFSSVFTSTSGIGGYDLLSTSDLGFSYDYDGSGFLSYMAFYRPGAGAFFIVQHSGATTFTSVFSEGAGGTGIGGYDLQFPADRAYAYDHNSSGAMNAIALFRPGTGAFFVVMKSSATGVSASVPSLSSTGSTGTVAAIPTTIAFTTGSLPAFQTSNPTDPGIGSAGSGARKEKPVLWILGCVSLFFFGL